MKLSLPAVMAFVAAFASAQQAPPPPNSSTASVAWGPSVNGLRLGAAFGADPAKPTLRVVFQNVGSAVQDVLIGAESGRGQMYDMKFIATAPDGKQQELVHRSLYIYGAVAGLILPFSVWVNAGETHELEFPLKDIMYASRTTVTLDVLVKQGYSVRVQFESKPWIGTLTSAEISPAR